VRSSEWFVPVTNQPAMRYKKGKIPYHIRRANIRFKLWRDPLTKPKMQAIQQYGTRRAAEIRFNNVQKIRDFFKQLPKELSYNELLEVIETKISLQRKNGKITKVRTFINKLRSKNILRFDALLGKWINLTLLQDSEQ
jgi:hypothetical protein